MAKASKLAKLHEEAAKRSGKRADKKRELARHTISTLGQLGYARTSLRDIAEQSGVSVGVLHYYFQDKFDLISYCVQVYKEEFIAELDAAMIRGAVSGKVIDEFINGLVAAIKHDAPTHTLWYDISAQALFDEAFRPIVADIENALVGLVARLLKRLKLDEASALTVYLGCDGVFRHFLLRHLSGDKRALTGLRAALKELFAGLSAKLQLP